METKRLSEKRSKQKLSKIISNNLFVLRIVWKVSKCRFLLKLFITVINALLPSVNILITRHVISLIESGIEKDMSNFRQILGYVVALMCFQVIPRIFSVWNATLIEPIFTSRINRYMNEIFIDKVKEFEYFNFETPEFYDRYTRALGQVDSITHIVFNNFFGILSGLISMASLIALIVSMDWIVILFALFCVMANFVQSLILSKLNYDTQVALTPVTRQHSYIKRILYMPDYAKDIKCSDIVATGKRYYSHSLKAIIAILRQHGLRVAIINTAITLLSSVSSATMMLLLFRGLWIGIYGIANFTALTSSTTQFESVLSAFLSMITSLYSNSMYIDDLKFVYNYKSESNRRTNVELDTDRPCKVEVRNLYYRYPNATNYALKNVSFTIMPGEKVSIVGLNGSGKTTLVKLLLGLYEPEKGDIFINDINIKDYAKEDLQKHIGIVFQDHHVYAYTIKENIAFENVIKDKTIETLKRLDMYDKISKCAYGFDTFLSKEFYDSGVNFSGGENQKICIARAINQSAPMYIFDEPSSALDLISENRMNEELVRLTDKTMIIISHRLSTVIMSDKIIVLQNGTVVEYGNHTSLMCAEGVYAELFKGQVQQFFGKPIG